jgi:hypothetical protein
MDPNQIYKDFCRALLEEDKETASDLHAMLSDWLSWGGFEPAWGVNGRKQFFTFNPATGRLE